MQRPERHNPSALAGRTECQWGPTRQRLVVQPDDIDISHAGAYGRLAELAPLLFPLMRLMLVHVMIVVSHNRRMRIPVEPIALLFIAHSMLAVATALRRLRSTVPPERVA